MKATMFHFSLEQQWQCNFKTSNLAERGIFKTTQRYDSHPEMTLDKLSPTSKAVNHCNVTYFASSLCSSYPIWILPIFSCMMLLVWFECTPQTICISQ